MAAYTSTGINTSATIVGPAGAEADYRGKAVKYNEAGAFVAAGAGEVAIGIGIVTNAEKTAANADVDVQVKEIGLGLAGAAIAIGAELASDGEGKLVTAKDGDFVIGTALSKTEAAGEYVHVQITKYQKSA